MLGTGMIVAGFPIVIGTANKARRTDDGSAFGVAALIVLAVEAVAILAVVTGVLRL